MDLDATVIGEMARRDKGMLLVGDVILGRYKLLEELGSGAMGMVFKCRDMVSQEIYAVKMVPHELSRDKELMDQIRENYRLVHKLKHPGIASVDFLEQDRSGVYYLIMEYVEGINLAQWIRQHKSAGTDHLKEKISIISQIAEALDYAHSEKVLHRDIKPANIMICRNGKVKVLDFGLASRVRSSLSNLSLFSTERSSGTPNYMAPEQFKAQYPRPATDQYALAVLTCELFSGTLPFEADNFEVLRTAVVNEKVKRPAGISNSVWSALKKALAKKPEKRFRNCTAFAKALKRRPFIVFLKFLALVYGGLLVLHVFLAVVIQLYRSANEKTKAAQSDAASQFALGSRYLRGSGVEKNMKKAVFWYRKAAQQGHAEAQYNLGICYMNGRGIKKDPKQAVFWYRKAAEQGDAVSQYVLGLCYMNGKGTEKNVERAISWIRKAAEQGNSYAQCYLGYCYMNGRGIKKDYSEAVKYHRKAAEGGSSAGMYNLGISYMKGLGVKKDPGEAVKYYHKAAQMGNVKAMYSLGLCYMDGNGTEKDVERAVFWYRKAAEQGNSYAQCYLGYCYANNIGVPQDQKLAVYWYRKAAEGGYSVGQYNLGYCYEYGKGIDKDLKQAVYWYRKAAAQGYSDARKVLQKFGE